jgi:glyoxylase-like metal-dependent hydrolase (beta-lactamase superfamily II)
VTARQVLDRVWMVGSGTDEAAFTDPHDCHCYLVWDGHDGFLVDCGTGLGAGRWIDNVREVCDPARLGGVLLSHYHADHAGGAASARELGLPVLAHPVTAQALRTGDEAATQLHRARDAGVYPVDYRLRPADVDALAVGAVLSCGDVSIEVVDAPGHCDGHVVFVLDAAPGPVLLSGDCLFAHGKVSMQAIPDCRLVPYADTVVSLAARRPDALLPGHGDVVVSGAAEVVERAAGAFRRLVPPPNLLQPW